MKEQNKTELISIIIPVYNAEMYIQRCVESILKQKYSNFEIIIVNDGSNDNSINILRELEKKDTRICIIDQLNSGVSMARNKGIDNIRGKYFTFVDADDYLDSEALFKAVTYLEKTGSDVVTYGWTKLDEKGVIIENCRENHIVIDSAEKIIEKILERYSAYGGGYPWNKLWKISDKLHPEYFNSKLHYFEDLEWVIRMMLQVNKMAVCPECLYNYVIHEKSATNNYKNRERNELSYHMSMESVIYVLNKLPDLQKSFKQKYIPEIINGIVHAKRNKWNKVEEYLWRRMLLEKKEILKMKIPFKTRVRFIRLLLLNRGKK